jgi:hypothetical protein
MNEAGALVAVTTAAPDAGGLASLAYDIRAERPRRGSQSGQVPPVRS